MPSGEKMTPEDGEGGVSSTKKQLAVVMELLEPLDEVRSHPMMGEFVLYYREKVIGGLFNDRLLLKATPSACTLLPEVERVLPYQGAKHELLAYDDLDHPERLRYVLMAMVEELPEPKRRMRLPKTQASR